MARLRPRWLNIPPPEPPDDPPGPPVPDFLPEGEYLLEVESIEEKTSQFGNIYYSLKCKIITPKVHPEFRVYFIISTAPTALWKFAEFIEATTGFRPVGQFQFTPQQYFGSRFNALLKIDKFQNHYRNVVVKVYHQYKPPPCGYSTRCS